MPAAVSVPSSPRNGSVGLDARPLGSGGRAAAHALAVCRVCAGQGRIREAVRERYRLCGGGEAMAAV
jgi:hypothetical protein